LPVITPGAIAGCIDRASGSSMLSSCSFSSGVMRFSLTHLDVSQTETPLKSDLA
jgi:hypothetical protein